MSKTRRIERVANQGYGKAFPRYVQRDTAGTTKLADFFYDHDFFIPRSDSW